MNRSALLIALLTVAVLCLTAPPAVASTPPEPICGACGSSFERTASQAGVAVNVTHSTASVQIQPNGSATWSVTNRIQNATGNLSGNSDTLTRIGQQAVASGGLPQSTTEPVAFQSATIENQTVRLTFRDPDAGTRHFGLLVVDYFHAAGSSGGWILNADRFSISGPAETTVLNDPRSIINDEYATADELPTSVENTLTWQRTVNEDSEATLSEEFYIAYGEPTTESTRVAAAVTMASVPIWLANVESAVLPAVVVYGFLLLGVTAVARRTVKTKRINGDLLSGVLAAIGLGVGVLAVIGPASLIGLGVIYLVVGLIGRRQPRFFESVRGTLAVAAVSTLTVGGVILGAGSVDPRFGNLAPTVAHTMVFHLPLAVAPVFGFAVTDSDGQPSRVATVTAFAGAGVAVLLAGAVFVPFDFRPWGLLLGTLGGAVFAAILGLPLAVLGARQSTTADSYEGSNRAWPAVTETADGDDT